MHKHTPKIIELMKQIGGNHYSKNKIQPIEYIMANNLGFCEGNIIKYITRYQSKGGEEDLDKIIHYCELLKQFKYEKIHNRI